MNKIDIKKFNLILQINESFFYNNQLIIITYSNLFKLNKCYIHKNLLRIDHIK